MLINKTVKTKWNPANKRWYESKGYRFTKWKDEFEVKIEDLTDGSNSLIEVRCDNCGRKLNMKWYVYLNLIKKDGKYYCKKCANKLYGNAKIAKTKLKNSQSFYDWCYNNLDKEQANEIISRWDEELNGCSSKDVCYGSHTKYYFKCPRGLHESELKNINGFTTGFIKGSNVTLNCKKCNSFAQYLIDTYEQNALEKYWSNKNIINPWEILKNSDKKVWIKCQVKPDYHKDYLVRCAHFVTNESRCPYCCNYHGNVHPKDSLGQYVVDNYGQEFLDKVWSNKNKKSPYEFSPHSDQKVWWKCLDEKHRNYKRRISNSIKVKFKCSECMQETRESILQEAVRKHLESLGYDILHEYNCIILPINPKTKYPLPFDNEIINLNLIIEVNGMQHYQLTTFHYLSAKKNKTTPEHELHYQQVKDRYKRIYAKSKGYEYLEIPYWADDENETWKKLIDDKLNEIIGDKNNLDEILKKNKEIIQTKNLQKILKQKQKRIKKYNKVKVKVVKRENFKGENNPRALKIICLNTKEVFDYMKLASAKYNIDNSNITKCCKGKSKFCGKDPITGEPLQWMYYYEYLKLHNSKEEGDNN